MLRVDGIADTFMLEPIQDLSRVREIYKACLKLIPHKHFTFAKVWVQYAEFEVRQLELDAARKIMGTAIGMAPKEKVRAGVYGGEGLRGTGATGVDRYFFTALQGIH
jgi:hypothetical protein